MPTTVTVQGRVCVRARASCSCCAARPTADDAPLTTFPWFTYRAGVADSDGVYYAYLCGDADGLTGCLEDVLSANARTPPTPLQQAARILTALNPSDPDGAQADYEDLAAAGLLSDL